MLAATTDNTSGEIPVIPDIRGLPLVDAGLALAARRIYLLLVTTGKNPGSHVGRGWPAKSSCNPDTITDWCAANPHGRLAIHTGRSGLIAFDYDREALADELVWLKTGLHQSSRGGRSARGHYVFASTQTFTSGKLKLSDGTVVGEVRSGNTVILTEPSPHPKADEGGEYRWITTGTVPPLPDEAMTYLTTKAGGGRQPRKITTGTELSDYLTAHNEQRQPWRRQTLRDKYVDYVRAGGKHQRSMMKVLYWAAREVDDGLVSSTVFDDLVDDYYGSFEAGDRTPPDNEFGRMVAEAVNEARKIDRETLRARHNRDFGTEHRDYAGLLEGIQFIPEPAGQPDKPADPSGNTVDSDDAESFWSSSPQLTELRQFAHARMVGPWAMLGNVLARIIAHIPPEVVLPPTVGDYASLNLFVAVVGRSGDSKSASMAAAGSWLRAEPDYAASKPGSGEGLAKCFAYVRKLPANQGGGTEQAGKQWSVLAKIPEVDTLTATAARGGATIMSTLREGWSGERLGTDYAADEKRIVLEANRYRLCLVIGVQPGRAGALFDDAEGGTPQRILWLPSADPDMPETEPDEPAPMNLGRWERRAPTNASPSIVPIDVDTARNRMMDDRADPTKFDVLVIPDIARDLIKATRRAVARGDASVDPLDGHKLLVQLKVAAALMVLERRRHTITDDDWKRAGIVMAVSDRTRAQMLYELERNRAELNRSRGADEAVREIAKTKVISGEHQRITSMAARIVDKLGEKDGQSLSVLRKSLSAKSNRDAFDDAATYAVESGIVRRENFIAHNGQEGIRLWLVPANGVGAS